MGKIKHADIGTELTKGEWEANTTHLDSQGNTQEMSRSATLIVAASNSSAKSKAGADYVCGDGTYTDDDEYIQAAIDALPIYGRLVCSEGTYNLANPIIFDDALVTFDCYGVLKPTGAAAIDLGSLSSGARADYLNIFVKEINGTDKSPDGIRAIWCEMSNIHIGKLQNCNRGIFFPQNGKPKGEIYFYYERITGCNYGAYSEAPYDSYDDSMSGNEFRGGGIFNCTNCGIYAQGKLGQSYVEGVIDCVAGGGDDFEDRSSSGMWVLNTKWIRRGNSFFRPSCFITGARTITGRSSIYLPKYVHGTEETREKDYTNYQLSVFNTGAVNKGLDQALLITGATANSTANLWKALRTRSHDTFRFDFTDEVILMGKLQPLYSVANAIWYFKVDDDETPADPDSVAFGFKMEDFDLIGFTHDGTNLHTIALQTLLSNGIYSLFCRLVKGKRIQWYVNDVLVGEDTTVANLPTGNLGLAKVVSCVTNGATAASKEIKFEPECEHISQ